MEKLWGQFLLLTPGTEEYVVRALKSQSLPLLAKTSRWLPPSLPSLAILKKIRKKSSFSVNRSPLVSHSVTHSGPGGLFKKNHSYTLSLPVPTIHQHSFFLPCSLLRIVQVIPTHSTSCIGQEGSFHVDHKNHASLHHDRSVRCRPGRGRGPGPPDAHPSPRDLHLWSMGLGRDGRLHRLYVKSHQRRRGGERNKRETQ